MHTMEFHLKLPIDIETCWDFFSDPSNLKVITPDYLGFQILDRNPLPKMYEGQIITYNVKPLFNVPILWVTEITHLKKHEYFIDEQRFGPYKFWHHEHHFYPVAGGVEMVDKIHYMLPLGILGKVVNAIKVKKDIEGIFAYRNKVLAQKFSC